ncbi:unnamed protein product [Rotaria sordida]|uniref:Uncharacterized protein n=1 Tax=Rotaria sordida TaxID=392033 RepID=A0A814Z7Z6_9BILA|nr:unnamed protein product [Rotaria sordida]
MLPDKRIIAIAAAIILAVAWIFYVAGNAAPSWGQQDSVRILLDRMPRLYSLRINKRFVLHLLQSKITSRSIGRLDLMHSSDWGYLENIELSLLANSPLGRQCEVLLIKVSVRENIFDLINTMPNLRALTCSIISLQQVKSNDDEASSSNMIKYDLLWLQNYLSFTSSIHLKPLRKTNIQLWIQ